MTEVTLTFGGCELLQTIVGVPGTASAAALRYSETIGDGSTTSFTITHSLATSDVHVQLYTSSGTVNPVLYDAVRTDANTVSLTFTDAPASGTKVVILA